MTADRVLACLKGIATGDAIGKQTELLSPGDVLRWYPRGVRGFEGVPGSTIHRYAGNRKREWGVGETTDDTERTIAVARAIVADRGAVSHISVGREMLPCTKCVHPGVRSLWEFHQAADPAGSRPTIIVYASDRLDEIVSGAREASISTHGGWIALAAAAATAAAVSSAIDGAAPRDIIAHAEQAAADAERRWPGPAPAAFASVVRRVHDELNGLTAPHPGLRH